MTALARFLPPSRYPLCVAEHDGEEAFRAQADARGTPRVRLPPKVAFNSIQCFSRPSTRRGDWPGMNAAMRVEKKRLPRDGISISRTVVGIAVNSLTIYLYPPISEVGNDLASMVK